jgi:hypothetical protein
MKYKIGLIFFYLGLGCQGMAQNRNIRENYLNDAQYEVINDLFKKEEGFKFLYSKTDFSKAWSILAHPQKLNNLLGPPCNNGKEILEWKEIFDKNEFGELKKRILNLKEFIIDEDKLENSIRISESIETSDKEVTVISAPIVIGSHAVIKQFYFKGESILFAYKKNNKWTIICRKSIFQKLD